MARKVSEIKKDLVQKMTNPFSALRDTNKEAQLQEFAEALLREYDEAMYCEESVQAKEFYRNEFIKIAFKEKE